jgi:hypothetical protein
MHNMTSYGWIDPLIRGLGSGLPCTPHFKPFAQMFLSRVAHTTLKSFQFLIAGIRVEDLTIYVGVSPKRAVKLFIFRSIQIEPI